MAPPSMETYLQRPPNPIDPIGHPRFLLEACLGHGGMGTVYRAYDREREAHVALKLLEKVTPTGLYRFKNEFRALGGVSHPNLLTLYELMSTGTHWFLTMELIDGVDLLTHIRRPEGESAGASGAEAGLHDAAAAVSIIHMPRHLPDRTTTVSSARPVEVRAPDTPPASTSREDLTLPAGKGEVVPRWNTAAPVRSPGQLAALRAAFTQLFAGLHALHAAGHLHRDVKPSNVLVARDGRVVVVDFGILLARKERSAPDERIVIGTPAYMAPEQAAGAALSPACDWYAVGVMLYELLCGRRPFTGSTEVLLALKQDADPTPIGELNPEAPADLVELCERLMKRRPEERPQGPELVGELRARVDAQTAASPAPTLASELAVPDLVGRAAELAVLGKAWQMASSGSLRTVLLSGRSGTGKTALMEHFLGEVRARGGTVVVGRSYQQESVPYKALDGLMDALAHYVGDMEDDVQTELAPALRTLGALFPVLRSDGDEDEAPFPAEDEPADPMERRRRLAPALRDLLSRVAARDPLCLVLDDAQWGDTESAVLLGQALARPWTQPVLLVLTYRAEDEGAAFLRTFTRWVAADVTLPLKPLSLDHATELVRQLLAARGADPRHAERIVKDARGIPLYLSELAFHAAEVSADSHSGAAPEALIGFTAMLRARVEALPAPARALLEAVSLAAQPIERGVAARAANLATADPSALVLLRNQRLIRHRTTARGDLLEVFHDRIREYVSASLPPETLIALHRRLALVLEASGGDPETLVTHFAACGEVERAGIHAIRAAELASRTLAFDRAAALYNRAIELRRSLPPAEALPLHIGLARAYAAGGRGLASATAYREAAALASDAAARSQLLCCAAEQLLTCGYVDDGVTLVKELLLEIGEKPREFSFGGVTRFLATRARLRLRGRGFTERREEDVDRHDLHRLDICWAAGAALGLHNPFQGVDFVSRHVLLALRVGEPHRIARGLAAECFAYAIDDSASGTRKWRTLVQAAIELALQIDDPRALGIAYSAEAMGMHQRALFRSGSVLAKQAARILRARCEQAHHEIHVAEMIALWTLSYIGELPELAARAARLAVEAEERGDLHRLATVQTGLPSLRFLVEGNVDEQTRIREDIVARLSPGYVDSPMLFHVMLSEALGLLYQGHGAGVWPLVAACEPHFRRSQNGRVPSLRLRCLWTKVCGALAAAWASGRASSERAEHLQRARSCLRQLDRNPLPLARAYADQARASLAAIAGKTEDAVTWLLKAKLRHEAIDCPTDMTMTAWQLGQLLGGHEGGQMVRDSEAWMRARGVRELERFVATLAPPMGP